MLSFNKLLDKAIETWKTMLENHCSKQAKMLTEHEFNMRKILRRNEGIWFSDFWMKVLGIFLFVYTVTLVLVAYLCYMKHHVQCNRLLPECVMDYLEDS